MKRPWPVRHARSLPPPWKCPSCGLPHRIATCTDVIPWGQWLEMTPDERAAEFIRGAAESLNRRLQGHQ